MGGNEFPTTQNTWIGQRVHEGGGGRAAVNQHVMRVYAWPLQVYFRGTRDRWLGEPEDIVHGFFADRLAKPGFFSDWQKSGLRLRRWLMNGFCFYLSELRHARRKTASVSLIPESVEDETPTPEEQMDRAFAVAIVRQAMEQAYEQCRSEGLGEHWQVFLKHHYQGMTYRALAGACGVSPARAAVMARTVARKFRRSLRELLARDGAGPDEIDRELESLLEITSHA